MTSCRRIARAILRGRVFIVAMMLQRQTPTGSQLSIQVRVYLAGSLDEAIGRALRLMRDGDWSVGAYRAGTFLSFWNESAKDGAA